MLAYTVSYLAPSGYKLTVDFDFNQNRNFGYVSNDKEWYPVRHARIVLAKEKPMDEALQPLIEMHNLISGGINVAMFNASMACYRG